MPPQTDRPAHLIVARLRVYLSTNPRGHLTVPPQAFRLDDDLRVVPDVGYIARENLAKLPSGDIPTHPDLAVLLRGPKTDLLALRQLCLQYIDHDTAVVWLVDAASRSVELFANQASGGTIMATAGPKAVVNGGTLLPGFQLRVADIFA